MNKVILFYRIDSQPLSRDDHTSKVRIKTKPEKDQTKT